MSLRSSLHFLFLIPFLSSCTTTQKAPIYSGPLLGDSVRIYPLPFPVNTEADEYAPSVSHDWKWMYFGRTIGTQTFLFKVMIDSGYAPGIPRTVERFLSGINTLAFAAPGRSLGQFVTVACNLEGSLGGCDLYELLLNSDQSVQMFTNLTRLNSSRWESYPAVSRSGEELWFSRERGKRSIGPREYLVGGTPYTHHTDMMISRYSSDGWGTPQSAPSSVNSTFDEVSPSFGFGDSVLFFSSNRPGGFGGFDIYMSLRQDNGEWSSPMNAGRPINSAGDDTGVFVLSDNRHLLISSDRKVEGAKGGLDLYVVEILGAQKSP